MARRFQLPATIRLEDHDAERVRRSHMGCILELQSVPVVGGHLIRDISLPDGEAVFVPHGLERRVTVFLSPPRASTAATTGRIREYRGVEVDGTKYVCLKASDWGETVVVDAWVF